MRLEDQRKERTKHRGLRGPVGSGGEGFPITEIRAEP